MYWPNVETKKKYSYLFLYTETINTLLDANIGNIQNYKQSITNSINLSNWYFTIFLKILFLCYSSVATSSALHMQWIMNRTNYYCQPLLWHEKKMIFWHETLCWIILFYCLWLLWHFYFSAHKFLSILENVSLVLC